MKTRPRMNAVRRRRRKTDARDQWLCELEMSDTVLREQIKELTKTVLELEDSRDKFLTLYNHSPIGYVTFDQKGRMRAANSAAVKLLGADPARRPALPLTLLLHQEDVPHFYALLSRLEQTTASLTVHVRLRTHDRNEFRPVEIITTPVNAGEHRLYLAVLVDLAERQKNILAAAQANEFAESIVETIHEPLAVLDCHLRIVLANRAFAAFVNRPKAVLKGNFFEALFDLCWNSNAVSAALEGVFLGGRELQNYEFQAEPHGRGRRILLMNARRLLPKGDAAAGILVALEDITERRRAEETLRDTNLQLEQRVTERTEDLQRSYEQMESFCYSIAHDLRAPLRSICGFSELLGIQFGEAIGAAGKEHTERIRQSAEHMDQLIQDLLNYGRLNTASLALGDVNLEEVFAQVLALLEKEIGEKRATVQKEGALPHVRGHQVVLQVMLTNLISNALKFVAPGVPPKVLIRSEDKGERARLWIEDNGIGIAPENRERIFGVFQRLHTSQSYPGTGIGLAIVSKGVERMRGRAGVESEPGKGSRFWIELQKASAPNERVAESVGKHAPGKQPPLPGMTPEEMRALSDQAERNGEPRAQVANPHIIPFPKKKSETRAEQKKRAS